MLPLGCYSSIIKKHRIPVVCHLLIGILCCVLLFQSGMTIVGSAFAGLLLPLIPTVALCCYIEKSDSLFQFLGICVLFFCVVADAFLILTVFVMGITIIGVAILMTYLLFREKSVFKFTLITGCFACYLTIPSVFFILLLMSSICPD